MAMLRRFVATAVALSVCTAVAGCGGGGVVAGPKHHHGLGTPTLPPLPTCPTPTTSDPSFPTGLSSDVPHPSFATDASYLPVNVKGVKLLSFTTQMPLRDAVLFVLKHYPSAGWVIGRGDSELHEADVPFDQGAIRGTTRLSGIATCTTHWLVATIQDNVGTDFGVIPQLAPHYTTTAPLPFGTASPTP